MQSSFETTLAIPGADLRARFISTLGNTGRVPIGAIANYSAITPRTNATLLDDATHPVFQCLAQDASPAIEDALVLGVVLAARDNDIVATIQKYQPATALRTGRFEFYV